MIFSYCTHVVVMRHWAVWGICGGFSAVFIQSGGGRGVQSGEVVIQEEWGRAVGMNHISSSSLTDSSAVKTEVFVLSHVRRDEMKWLEFNQFEMKLDTWAITAIEWDRGCTTMIGRRSNCQWYEIRDFEVRREGGCSCICLNLGGKLRGCTALFALIKL